MYISTIIIGFGRLGGRICSREVEGDAAGCGGDTAGRILLDGGGRSSQIREISVDMVKARVLM
jgi:hypothetical protein